MGPLRTSRLELNAPVAGHGVSLCDHGSWHPSESDGVFRRELGRVTARFVWQQAPFGGKEGAARERKQTEPPARAAPVELLGLVRPEADRVLHAPLVHRVIFRTRLDQRLGAHLLRGVKQCDTACARESLPGAVQRQAPVGAVHASRESDAFQDVPPAVTMKWAPRAEWPR